MKTSELLVSSVNITEDEYCYKGLFILSGNGKSITVDIAELDQGKNIEEIKELFQLDEPNEIIKKSIMEMVMEKASISSKINEGESYNEGTSRKRVENAANSMNMA